ncbi:MAG: DUF6261 family protein [Prevotellaceae bacterium]|jgi:hypothetical protein|nr:DUF6261 family protein [Prevotellaceae bacterium]
MATKLNKPDVNRYNNADHIEFHELSCKICDKYRTAISAPALITAYYDSVAQEESIYKWVRKSEFTEKKAETDYNRDRIYTGIMSIVRSNLKHFDPAVRDNARHVYNLLENYGDLTHAGYDAETAGIDSVVARLNSNEYILAVQSLGLEPWINELASQNTLFKEYVNDTAQEHIDKPAVDQRMARRQTDDALRSITNRVTALIELNGAAEYSAFADEFNVLTNHYNTLVHEHYGRIHAKTDISPADIAPIEVQQYTGKPIYVIPAVSIRKTSKDGTETTVELTFSVDFTVAYKNNVSPGTATLIINGIGKYIGELTTTFNIMINGK